MMPLKSRLCDESAGNDLNDGRIALLEEIARSTESSLRTWGWLRGLTKAVASRELDAIIYPSTMAGASALIHRLEVSGVDWQALGSSQRRGVRNGRAVVAVSLRLLDESLLFDGERIRVHAGYSVSALAYAASERGLTGLEPLIQMRGSLGDYLRPGRKGELWHLVEEVIIARNGVLKVILTRGEDLTPDQRSLIDGALIVAATLRLNRVQSAVVEDEGTDRFPTYADSKEVVDRQENSKTSGDVIPLTERMKSRAAREFQLELEYDLDGWREDS